MKAVDWDSRAERLIASLRLALAAGSLMVIWFDPTQPARHWRVAYVAFVLYLLYSLVVFQMARARPRPWLPIVTQVIDLLWVLPVLYFTEGANTPFFPFFVVFTLNAGIRWGGAGAWAVSIYSVLVYGWLLLEKAPGQLDLNNDLMRLGYFLIVGALGGYLAEYRRRREAELGTLQAMSEEIAQTYEPIAATAVLVDMAARLRVADVVVAVVREPGGADACMVRGRHAITPLSEAEVSPFFEAAASPPRSIGGRAVPLTETNAKILRFADADTGVACPIRSGADLVGAIFFLARASRARRASGDFLDLLLRAVIPQIETLYVLERARHLQMVEERRRIARDLHDSFIQVLAALGLRLDVLGATSDGDAAAAPLRRDLGEMRLTITDELRRVRAYLAEMREPLHEVGSLRDLVERTAEAFRSRTRIPIDLTLDEEAADIAGTVVRDVAPILREALTNVEKHARASHVAVSARLAGGDLSLVVRDDGRGLGAGRRLAADAAPGHAQGIASMRERARLLGGTVTLSCPASGGTLLALEIPIPVRA